MNRIHTTNEFTKQARKLLSYQEQREMDVLRKRLKVNARIGDTIGPHWVRECRIGTKRVYFLIEEPVVILIMVSGKKDQQTIIDRIRENENYWKRLLLEATNAYS